MMFIISELAYFRYRFSFPEEYHFITTQDAAIDLLDLSLREAAELKSRVSRCTHTIDLTLNVRSSSLLKRCNAFNFANACGQKTDVYRSLFRLGDSR